jgi:hypothetical protein
VPVLCHASSQAESKAHSIQAQAKDQQDCQTQAPLQSYCFSQVQAQAQASCCSQVPGQSQSQAKDKDWTRRWRGVLPTTTQHSRRPGCTHCEARGTRLQHTSSQSTQRLLLLALHVPHLRIRLVQTRIVLRVALGADTVPWKLLKWQIVYPYACH